MTPNPRIIVRERGVLAQLETEEYDGITIADLIELADTDPEKQIEQMKNFAIASLDRAKQHGEEAKSKQSPNTREDLRRTGVLIQEYAGHTLGQIMRLEEAIARGEISRAVHHAILAGFYAAKTEDLFHEPNAALGTRQRPHPTKGGRARQSKGTTTEQRHAKIRKEFNRVVKDPEFPKKGLQVEEVAHRCNCSPTTVHRALRGQ